MFESPLGALIAPNKFARPLSAQAAPFELTPRQLIFSAAKGVAIGGAALMAACIAQDLYLLTFSTLATQHKIWLLDVDSEQSLYTWISVCGLAASALALFAITRARYETKSPHFLLWGILFLGFAFLSADELVSIHEKIALGSGSGVVGWAYVAIPSAIVLGVAFANLLLSLPRNAAIMFLIGGCVFVFGAAGLEIIGEKVTGGWQPNSLTYRAFSWAEESLELAGNLIFLFSIVHYWDELLSPNYAATRRL